MNYLVDQPKMRLDVFLAAQSIGVSRGKIQKDIFAGKINVNGVKILEAKYFVKEGDSIEYDFSVEDKITSEPLEIEVIFENNDLLIINKPAGLVVHPAPGYKGITLAAGLLHKYKGIKGVGEDEIRPGIVHRLDKDTSGVILVAKTQEMFEHLKDSFAKRTVKKEYIALVCGRIKPEHNIIDAPIGRHSADFRKMSTVSLSDPKAAVTEYQVLEHLASGVDEYSLLRVKLHTGRTHQIRVHFSSLGHPLAGDTLYGKCKAPQLSRQFLHAAKIEVQLPDQTWIEADAPLPEDLKKVLDNLTPIK